MTKELSKAVTNKSKTRNKYIKWPSRENFLAMKIAKTTVIIFQEQQKITFFKELLKVVLLTIGNFGMQSNHS